MSAPAALARYIEACSDPAPCPAERAGVARCLELSALLDDALVELGGDDPAFALVAVGGSGRREQCRHSDIDIMVLVRDDADQTAPRALYPLWDAQLKVGHSIRTPRQALSVASASFETFTALLDARFLHGDRALFDQFAGRWRKLVRSRRRWLHEELAEQTAARRQREAWQVMAVDVKTSRGGLRDLQALHWLRVARGLDNGEAASPDHPELEDVRERLLATRNALHALHERPTDLFPPQAGPPVAEWLGVDGFEWARGLYGAMRRADAALADALREPPARRRWWWPFAGAAGSAQAPAPDEDASDLDNLLAALRGAAPEGPLEPLPRSPWLARLLPEWEVLRHRPHVAPFHVNPGDVHVHRAVAEASAVMRSDEFDTGTDAVAADLDRPDEVLLATFLHDIGKGHSGDHSEAGAVIADRVAVRAGLEPEARHRLVTAVRHHLLLPAVATRRDIADEHVIRETARQVEDTTTLRLLYLLSIADARASGPNVWSAWKAQLMRSLYQRVLGVLDASDADDARTESVVEQLAGRFDAATVRAHLDAMGPDYVLSTPAGSVGDHLALIAEAGDGAATRLDRLGEIDRLTVVTRDRPGLLQSIAGVLAVHNATVLGGVAHTRNDGVAIQVWHVRDALGHTIDDRRWTRLLDALPDAVAGTFPIDGRLAEVRATYPEPRHPNLPTRIGFDNRASRDYSVLEVSTADRRGLLYAVTTALHAQGVDIHLAKMDTIGPEVMDAFYVCRENGRRIEDPDEMERLRAHIAAAIAALDA